MTIKMLRARFNGSLQHAADENKASRSFDFVCSTPDVDSSGRIVVQDWDLARFKKNPVVLWNHGMGASFWGNSDDTDLTLPIGYASNVRVEDDKLKATLTIVDEKANPIAEKVYQGLLQGSLRCTSVGWWPRDVKYEKHDGEDVAVMSGNQLLEISVVTIPANAEATKEAASFAAQLKQLGKSQDMKNIAKRLGLLETASEEEVLAKIDELTARVDDCETRLTDLEGGGSASDDSTDESATDESAAAEAATACLERIRASAEKAGRKAFAERIASLFHAEKTLVLQVAADAERIESERLAEIDRLCARAMEEGKMTPSSKVHALAALGDKPSVEQVKRMIAGLLISRSVVDTKAKKAGGASTQEKTFEQMTFSERAALMQDNKPLYDELKADFERRRGGR